MPHKKKSIPIPELDIEHLGLVRPGTKVKHAVFGRGTIKDIAQWVDGSHTVQVDFLDHGTKWLVPTYAKLLPDDQ